MAWSSCILPYEVKAIGDGERQQVDVGREGAHRCRRENHHTQRVADQADHHEHQSGAQVAVVRQLDARRTVEQIARLVGRVRRSVAHRI